MHRYHRLGAGILAGSLFVSGVGSTFAASHTRVKAHVGTAYGQVSNVSPAGFTLTRALKHPRANGTSVVVVQVSTSPATSFIARKGTTGTLVNGEYAAVAGTRSTTGVTARRVVFSTAPFALHRHRVAGTVSISTPTSITIQTRAGVPVTFEITAQTRVRINRQVQPTVPTFTTGERVVVIFARDMATTKRLARVIVVRPTKPTVLPQP
ncbi:MAG: hypothetical protein NVS2B16_13230 [Chloroflexota bacterium]